MIYLLSNKFFLTFSMVQFNHLNELNETEKFSLQFCLFIADYKLSSFFTSNTKNYYFSTVYNFFLIYVFIAKGAFLKCLYRVPPFISVFVFFWLVLTQSLLTVYNTHHKFKVRHFHDDFMVLITLSSFHLNYGIEK